MIKTGGHINYDEINVLWCGRTENPPDKDGCNR